MKRILKGLGICFVLTFFLNSSAFSLKIAELPTGDSQDPVQETLTTDPQSQLNSQYVFDVTVPPAIPTEIKSPDGTAYILYSLDKGFFTTVVGKPKLPVLYEKVAIPVDASNVQVEVVNSYSNEEVLNHPIYPVPKPIIKRDNLGFEYSDEEFTIDSDFYHNSHADYPEQIATIRSLSEMRGLRYAEVEIHPLQYNPSGHSIRIHQNITLKVTWFSSSNQINSQELEYDYFLKPVLKDIQNLPQSTMESMATEAVQPLTTLGVVNRPTNLLNNTPTDYLIITANDFYNSPSINQLANHRASIDGGGYRVSIVRIQDIYNTLFPDKQGTETNDQVIKIFIKYVYDHWNGIEPPFKFVLLVGDALTDNTTQSEIDGPNLVPTHISTIRVETSRIATDDWYARMGGSYPSYLSDTFDQVDDVVIGRFPIKTQEELQRVTNKTVRYETVLSRTSGDWRSQAGLISGFFGNSSQDSYISTTRASYSRIKNNYLIPHSQEVFEDYRNDYNNSLTDMTENERVNQLFKEKIKASFNSGRLLTVVASHGDPYGWYGYGQFFNKDDVRSLTNNDKLSIVANLGCSVAYFDTSITDSIAEAFIKDSDAGAVAFLGFSRVAYLGTGTDLVEQFVGQVINNKTIGNALLATKAAYYDEAHRLMFNLFGDPALDVSKVKQNDTKPDLTGSITGSQKSGNNFTFHAIIKNLSLNDASNVSLDLYDGDPNQGGARIPVEIEPITAIAAGQEVSSDIVVPMWNDSYRGYIYLLVNGAHQIAELSYSNNVSAPYYLSVLQAPLYQDSFIGQGTYSKISGNKIVWQSYRNSVYDIYFYDLGPDGIYGTADDSGEIKISTGVSFKISPAISGNKIVWLDLRNRTPDVYMYDLGSDGIYGTADDSGEVRGTTSSSLKMSPAISGNKIIWIDRRNNLYGIYMYDLGADGIVGTSDDSGEIQIATTLSVPASTAIFGNKIVWGDRRDGVYGIYFYDLGPDGIYGTHDDSGEITVTTSSIIRLSPAIVDNKIVWTDFRDNANGIYLYDLGRDGTYGTADDLGVMTVSTSSAFTLSPTIFGNKIVWAEAQYGGFDIYTYGLGPDGIFGTADDANKKPLRIEILSTIHGPIISGNKVVYDDYSNVHMINANLPPALYDLGDKTVNEGESLDFSISAVDSEGDPLTYLASNLPPGATFDVASKTFHWTPNYDQAGVYAATFAVSDRVFSDSKTINITVNNVNRAPILNSIGNKVVNENSLLSFVVSATDPDGDRLMYQASNLPAGATFGKNGTFSWTPTYDQAGTYKITFSVNDGILNTGSPSQISEDFLSDSRIITITVNNVNRAPALSDIGNKSINEGWPLSFTITGSDPDNDSLSYSASNLPSGATLDAHTGIFSWKPNYDQAGSYTVTFTVKDGVLTNSKTITITVNNVNRSPIFNNIPNQVAYMNKLLTFKVTATDPDGDPLTFSATGLPSGATFNASTQIFSWTPKSTEKGKSYLITFTVKDPLGKYAVWTMRVDVK